MQATSHILQIFLSVVKRITVFVMAYEKAFGVHQFPVHTDVSNLVFDLDLADCIVSAR